MTTLHAGVGLTEPSHTVTNQNLKYCFKSVTFDLSCVQMAGSVAVFL